MPTEIQRAHTFTIEKLHLAIGKMIVNPVRKRAPICPRRISIGKPGNGNTRRRATQTFFVLPIPDVACVVAFIAGAI